MSDSRIALIAATVWTIGVMAPASTSAADLPEYTILRSS